LTVGVAFLILIAAAAKFERAPETIEDVRRLDFRDAVFRMIWIANSLTAATALLWGLVLGARSVRTEDEAIGWDGLWTIGCGALGAVASASPVVVR